VNGFQEQRIKVEVDHQDSPQRWVESILAAARAKSSGLVEQYLVGAYLQKRFPEIEIPTFPASAGNYIIGSSTYHVTSVSSRALIRKCKEDLSAGKHPVLIVPRDKIGVARSHAEAEGIEERLSVFGIEDYLTMGIIGISDGEQARFLETLRDILREYNQWIETAETDQSLKIDTP